MLSRYVMGSVLSISLVLAGVAVAQPGFIASSFAAQVAGTPKYAVGRFALTASGTGGPAFVVARDFDFTGSAPRIKVQRVEASGTLGWSASFPFLPNITDADGIAVTTDENATKVFVTGWVQGTNGPDIVTMAFNGTTGAPE